MAKTESVKPRAYWYRATGTRHVTADLTDEEAKHLRRLARQHDCLVMDLTNGYPVPSTRALVQAIAAGRLRVTRVPDPDKTNVSEVPRGGCPKD